MTSHRTGYATKFGQQGHTMPSRHHSQVYIMANGQPRVEEGLGEERQLKKTRERCSMELSQILLNSIFNHRHIGFQQLQGIRDKPTPRRLRRHGQLASSAVDGPGG